MIDTTVPGLALAGCHITPHSVKWENRQQPSFYSWKPPGYSVGWGSGKRLQLLEVELTLLSLSLDSERKLSQARDEPRSKSHTLSIGKVQPPVLGSPLPLVSLHSEVPSGRAYTAIRAWVSPALCTLKLCSRTGHSHLRGSCPAGNITLTLHQGGATFDPVLVLMSGYQANLVSRLTW